MTQVFHSSVNDIVPWQAHYSFPSQSVKATKQTVKFRPKNGDSFGPRNTIRIEFPSDGYMNVLNSVLTFDLSIDTPNRPPFLDVPLDTVAYTSATIAIPDTGITAVNALKGYTVQLVLEDADGVTFEAVSEVVSSAATVDSKTVITLSKTSWLPIYGRLGGINGTFAAGSKLSMFPGVYLQQGGGHQLIRRLRLIYGGLVLEDLQEYHEIARLLIDSGVGENYLHAAGSILDGTHGSELDESTSFISEGSSKVRSGKIQAMEAASKKKTLALNLFSGLLTCKKLLPLKWMAAQFVIEIELNPAEVALIDSNYGEAHSKASTYTLTDVAYLAELMDFDSMYDTAFFMGLKQTGVPLKFSSWHYHSFNLTGVTNFFNLHERARSVKSAFAVIKESTPSLATDSNAFLYNMKQTVSKGQPVAGAAEAGVESYQWRIGGKYYPAQPVRCEHGAGEAYVELLKDVDALGDYTFSTNMSARDWAPSRGICGNKFIMASEFENVDVFPDTMSGINAEEQSDMTLNIKLLPAAGTPTGKRCDVFVAYDSMIILKEGNVLDLVL